MIELDWVTLCEVELVNTARLVNTGVMTTACTPWPPSCPRFNQHPHTPIYTHSPTTASKLSLFSVSLLALDQFPSRQNNPTCIPTMRTRKKDKKCLRHFSPSRNACFAKELDAKCISMQCIYLSKIYLSVYLSSSHLCINLHIWASTAHGKKNFNFK